MKNHLSILLMLSSFFSVVMSNTEKIENEESIEINSITVINNTCYLMIDFNGENVRLEHGKVTHGMELKKVLTQHFQLSVKNGMGKLIKVHFKVWFL